MIKVEKLSKKYGKNHVLKNINVSFEAGKVIGIVGENGSGKTTFFNCITGLESFEGSISSPFKSLKDHVGFLQTESFFFAKITGEEYLQFFANARDIKIEDIVGKNIFNLPLNQYASTYSTGMKKKLALTAILIQKNDFFIFDEPFNGVDIQSNIIITEIILKLKSLQKTIILSSHIFDTLAKTCDEIYVLENGCLSNKILQKDFMKLEAEMKKITLANKIDRLGL